MKQNNGDIQTQDNGAGNGFDVDEFFKPEADVTDIELIQEIITLQKQHEVVQEECDDLAGKINRKKVQLTEILATKQITSMTVNGHDVKVVPYENYSINRKGASDKEKEENARKLKMFLEDFGLGEKVKQVFSIHYQTLQSIGKKLHDPDGDYKLELSETKEKLPFLNHSAGTTVKITEKK